MSYEIDRKTHADVVILQAPKRDELGAVGDCRGEALSITQPYGCTCLLGLRGATESFRSASPPVKAADEDLADGPDLKLWWNGRN